MGRRSKSTYTRDQRARSHASADGPGVVPDEVQRGALCIDEAVTLHGMGRLAEAVTKYQAAVTVFPTYAELHNNLGAALLDQGYPEEAADSFRTAVGIRPDLAASHKNLGDALAWLGDFDQAIESYGQALELRPNSVTALCGLGTLFRKAGLLEDAVSVLGGAIVIDPALAELHVQFGLAYLELHRWRDSIESLEHALRLEPGRHEARRLLAGACLISGDFDRGFNHFRRVTSVIDGLKRDFPQPEWDGASLNGRSILLHVEQSFAEGIMFIRYAPLVKAMGGVVMIEAPRSLRRLFESCRGVDRLISQGDELPDFDVHAPLSHLPALLRTTSDTIPAQIPYLVGSVGTEDECPSDDEIHVGIVWQGYDTDDIEPDEAASLADFEPLLDTAGVKLYSLQRGAGLEQLAAQRWRQRIVDVGSGFEDFAETARTMESLDLVISVDTAVAHVAGALGRPVWLLLPPLPKWYWFVDRSDSPWYPTARLFRQTRAGVWTDVMHRVASALEAEVRGGVAGPAARRVRAPRPVHARQPLS